MIFGFRADASILIGSGHIIRCLTVAEALKKLGHSCIFICRNHEGNLIEFISEKGFSVVKLAVQQNSDFNAKSQYATWLGVTEECDAEQTLGAINGLNIRFDWLIVDHYALSKKWERLLRKVSSKVMIIDDLANREHDAELILDCGLVHKSQDYEFLNQRDATYLLGPKYALLRPEFSRCCKHMMPKSFNLKDKLKVLINLGGVDKDNITSQILNVFIENKFTYIFDLTIVMGISAPWKEEVIQRAQCLPNAQVLVNVSNMAELMVDHDLAIGAAGSTAWERCCLGLPSIMICMADNQKMIADELYGLGAAISLQSEDITKKLYSILESLTASKLSEMSNASQKITQGQGVDLLIQHIFQVDKNTC